MRHTRHDMDSAGLDTFYQTLYDFYVEELQQRDQIRFWAVPAPDHFISPGHCTVSVRGTREHWALHVHRRDSGEEYDLSPGVAHWWMWTHGAEIKTHGLESDSVIH